MGIREQLKYFYSTSTVYLDYLRAREESYVRHYVSFVKRYAPYGARILNVGCGACLSSLLLTESGYNVIGVDISFLFLSQAKSRYANLKVVVGDALDLPFRRYNFDIVTSCYLIEHIPDVGKALSEMSRVLKRNGLLLIKAPNLISPWTSLMKCISIFVGEDSRRRRSSLWGETRLRAIKVSVRNLYLSLKKRLSSRVDFMYREPDFTYIIEEADSDSVYLANQIDLKKFFSTRELEVINLTWGQNRVRRKINAIFASFAPSIGFVAKKYQDKGGGV